MVGPRRTVPSSSSSQNRLRPVRLALVASLVVAAGLTLFFAAWKGGASSGTPKSAVRGASGVAAGKVLSPAEQKKLARKKRLKNPVRQISQKKREKPTFELDEDDESLLNEEQKAIIEAIRDALDREKFPELIKLVRKMQDSNLWPDGYPVVIRKAAIDVLGWFGRDAIPEIVGFLGDPNEEVLAAAIEAYEMSLIEANGDAELSTLLIAACQAINDPDAIDSFMMEINNMRPSRVVSTLEEIAKTGTPAAQAALSETISFYTGEDECTTVEKLKEWYNDPSGENMDDEDAEEFYGPQKENDD